MGGDLILSLGPYIGRSEGMPRRPRKPCRHPGCPELTEGLYCLEHGKQHNGDRLTSSGRGYGSRWRRARNHYLKAHPLCGNCRAQGRLRKATVVDHIIPHRGDQQLFWDESNWQPLCKSCHDHKTMTEDRYQEYKY
jgi:5-methylcytosine-specific restriction protein A